MLAIRIGRRQRAVMWVTARCLLTFTSLLRYYIAGVGAAGDAVRITAKANVIGMSTMVRK